MGGCRFLQQQPSREEPGTFQKFPTTDQSNAPLCECPFCAAISATNCPNSRSLCSFLFLSARAGHQARRIVQKIRACIWMLEVKHARQRACNRVERSMPDPFSLQPVVFN